MGTELCITNAASLLTIDLTPCAASLPVNPVDNPFVTFAAIPNPWASLAFPAVPANQFAAILFPNP